MRHSAEQRRLLAVVVADIVGYSRLMAEDEADTFYRLKDLQASLIIPATDRNHGHVVKWTGDGFIVTFDSAVDAVRAAVEIQSGAAAAGAGTPDDRRIRFRVGITWYVFGTPRDRAVIAAPASRPVVPPPAPAGPADPAGSGLRTGLAIRLASAVPALGDKTREDRAREYEIARGHKAQAASPDPVGTWRATGRPTAGNAEAAALEQCQIFFGQPCTLLAVDQTFQPLPKDGELPRRAMSRLRHSGPVEPA